MEYFIGLNFCQLINQLIIYQNLFIFPVNIKEWWWALKPQQPQQIKDFETLCLEGGNHNTNRDFVVVVVVFKFSNKKRNSCLPKKKER